jgi:hypothetical protein
LLLDHGTRITRINNEADGTQITRINDEVEGTRIARINNKPHGTLIARIIKAEAARGSRGSSGQKQDADYADQQEGVLEMGLGPSIKKSVKSASRTEIRDPRPVYRSARSASRTKASELRVRGRLEDMA